MARRGDVVDVTQMCENCRYWFEPWKADGEAEGQCRRFPPTTPCMEIVLDERFPRYERAVPVEAHGMMLTDYPLVLWDGWCGEWKAKEES